MKIYPSLISGDILNIEKMVTTLNDVCDGYHVDVMDDHFVPNLTWGPAFVAAIGSISSLPLHVHLMVDKPGKWLDRLTLKKDDLFIFHHEVFFHDEDIVALLESGKKCGCKVGIAVNPKTDVDKVFSCLSHVDHVLLMSVEPGFSGQSFMPEVVEKVQPLVAQRNQQGVSFTIGMDGGIGKENIKMVADAGVDCVGIASAIFSQKNSVAALKELYNIL